jgi:hypothetical protein
MAKVKLKVQKSPVLIEVSQEEAKVLISVFRRIGGSAFGSGRRLPRSVTEDILQGILDSTDLQSEDYYPIMGHIRFEE